MPRAITITGASGSGKSTLLDMLTESTGGNLLPSIIPKFTTRAPRPKESASLSTASRPPEVLCVSKIPPDCDLVYEQYGDRYGLSSATLFAELASGRSPVVILNDIRTVEDVRRLLGPIVVSIFVFRRSPNLESFLSEARARGTPEQQEQYQVRFRKAQAIHRIYIENIHLFDHVILNVGSTEALRIQAMRLFSHLGAEEGSLRQWSPA